MVTQNGHSVWISLVIKCFSLSSHIVDMSMTVYYDGNVEAPSVQSFEGKLLDVERQLAGWKKKKEVEQGHYCTSLEDNFIAVLTKQQAVLQKLIETWGPRPTDDGKVIGMVNDVYEEKNVYSLPQQYQTSLFQSSFNGREIWYAFKSRRYYVRKDDKNFEQIKIAEIESHRSQQQRQKTSVDRKRNR